MEKHALGHLSDEQRAHSIEEGKILQELPVEERMLAVGNFIYFALQNLTPEEVAKIASHIEAQIKIVETEQVSSGRIH